MTKTIPLYVLLLFFTCMCKSRGPKPDLSWPNPDLVKVSDTTHEIIIGTSIYESIAPPKLTTDSAKFYEQLKEVLQLSNKLEYLEDRVDSDELDLWIVGQIQKGWCNRWVTDDREPNMNKVMDFIFTTDREQAFFNESPSKKVPCSLRVIFNFYRDLIQFDVYGPEYYPLLSKAYNPNYSKVD